MSENTNLFPSIPFEGPIKQSPELRRANFKELYERFTAQEARRQASRCAQCGIPYCQHGCPLQNNIPDWLRLTAEGDYYTAWVLASQTNSLPEICGRICPQDRLCEGACTLEASGWEHVTIGAVERFLGDMAWEEGWILPISDADPNGLSVAIIGSGPAGLAAADRLLQLGYQVTIYDRHDRAGGLLSYGIPSFKLEKDVVARRTERLVESGAKFQLNSDIGHTLPFETLRQSHDAVLIATGVYRARQLQIPGAGLSGILPALDFLIAANQANLGYTIDADTLARRSATGRNVVVIGGGDTAMDCVRTAIRQGARQVTCVYRKQRTDMPGSEREIINAEEEGVRFEWSCEPIAFTGEAGHLIGLEVAEARRPGSRQIEADLVIEAIGFEPEDFPRLFQCPDLKIRSNGTLEVKRGTYETSLPGVFAAGDIVRGASLAVWAVREGQDAAAAIHRHLRAGSAGGKAALRDRSIIHFGADRLSPQAMRSLPPQDNSGRPTT